jgi:hypothetical protein
LFQVNIVRQGRASIEYVNYWGEHLMRGNTNPFLPNRLEDEEDDESSS